VGENLILFHATKCVAATTMTTIATSQQPQPQFKTMVRTCGMLQQVLGSDTNQNPRPYMFRLLDSTGLTNPHWQNISVLSREKL